MAIASMMTSEIAKGQMIPLHFSQTDLAVSQTDVQLGTGDDAGTAAGYVMPFAGEIIAISYLLSTNKTAGVMTVGPTINGTESASLTQTVANATSSGTEKTRRGSVPFAVGSSIGAELTTDASFLPITADLVVTVWVILSLEGI